MNDPYPRVQLDLATYTAKVRSGACFICGVIAGNPDNDEVVVYRDDAAIAFLNRFPTLAGYVLVAPLAHVEEVVDGFDQDDYLRLQSVIYRVGRAITAAMPTERLYVASLGSKQGNAHVHWHLAPLPPGVAYHEQQFHALMTETMGYLAIPPAEQVAIGERIAAAMDSDQGATSPR
ncbi:HIT family protein [Actinopolymorpha alba]|uniref:HIT family protein n=1 Tax=Actinopolymorpha alba TaxID=533267 RepID=UPI000365138A|nr:HIT family protein [Actinopolymorpha alba]